MPELPEVETVRRGLAPYVEGARIEAVALNRADLRFPFPPQFAESLLGQIITHLGRRAKYLLFTLSSGDVWLSHLGMTGSYRFLEGEYRDGGRYYQPAVGGAHDHFALTLGHPAHGTLHLIYADPRRFGFMDLIRAGELSPYLADLGPEPLSNEFSASVLATAFRGKTAPVKTGLLDQRVVAGIGNIYACEALHRARIHPERPAGTLVRKGGGPGLRLERLAIAVREVLLEAIEAGGSTLRDFRNAEGGAGGFQHRFAMYDREGEPCPRPACRGSVRRIVQSGRSTFYCPVCQR